MSEHGRKAEAPATTQADAVTGATVAAGNGGSEGAVDAATGATSLADAAAALDHGSNQPPLPACASPGTAPGAAPEGAPDQAVDAETGATPGVASACKDLGLSSLDAVSKQLGIKPPGVA